MTITEVLVPAQEVAWLPWAVQYFFYIGSAYAAAILFALALFCHRSTSHTLRSVLALVLAISALVGPLALTAELHQPGRAWHFFAHLTPSSWMSRGAVLLPLFSILSTITAWLYLRPEIQALSRHTSPVIRLCSRLAMGKWQTSLSTMKVITLLTVISGLSIALYTGSEIAVLRSRPLWNQLTSPILWFVTAFLATGGLSLLMLATLKPILRQDLQFIRRTVLLSALLSCVLFPLWLVNGNGLELLDYSIWRWRTGLMMLLLVASLLVGWRFPTGRKSIILLSLLSIATCWYLRWLTILDVQTIPRYDAGMYPNALAWGSSGVLGIIGMAGLWLALAVVTTSIINQADNAALSPLAPTVQGEYHE
ncbi:tetrathionate reductase [Pragia fontium]|uniref:Tetrathionate reductase n=1 Tax=Pragia fontium TaxID=82985 RepID=A0ABQ5LM77_9GAMM|nr:NrfD/PsrC family molybdoenzyme membrane anchor subunit [Pragia fontium]GKX64469.1 tetrathionate reductase [Pragia fontium]